MYGTQAAGTDNEAQGEFENDVKMYGTQAAAIVPTRIASLRMM